MSPRRRTERGHALWSGAQLAGAATLLLISGCRACDTPLGPDRCATIPPGAMPPPAGTYACQWQTAQMERGELSKYVVHKYEWQQGGRTLGPEGRRHVEQLARRLPQTSYVVALSPADDDALNDERRAVLVQHLANAGVADAPNRVVIARPEGEGLYGPESARYGAARALGITTTGQQGNQGGGGAGSFNTNSFGGGGGGFGGGGGGGGFGGGGTGFF